jgi:hypothetical protein
MQVMVAAGLALAMLFAGEATAADKPFTGVFEGTGRACSGNLYIRSRTVEWNTPFSVCKRAAYDVLEKDFAGDGKRLALHRRTRSKRCAYVVIEIAKVDSVSPYAWNVTGYQSLEAFQKRVQPDWLGSPLPERLTLSCPTVLLD